METPKIANRTIKDIFEKMFEKGNAGILLARIQEAYEKGLRGEELENYAKHEINELHLPDAEFTISSTRVGIAVSFGGALSI